MRRAGALLVIALWWSLVPVFVLGRDEAARVVNITSHRAGKLVVCHLQTMGLPAEKQLQSMHSGLVSSVELNLSLLDENDHLLGGNIITLRLAFDLWEEVFSVREDGQERRFHSLDDLTKYLSDLKNLPVIPAASLEANHRYRLRVGMIVNSIAPDEQKRVEGMIAGDNRPQREGRDQQEASVSLGRLIRFFYKGDHSERAGSELHSAWFTPRELNHETD